MSSDHSFTDGPLLRPLLALAWPIVGISLLQTAYNLVDVFWLGRLSAAAVAAVGISYPIVFLVTSFASGLTMAGGILVSQHTGAERLRAARESTGNTLALATSVALVVGMAGFMAIEPLLQVLPTPPATTTTVIPLASSYLRLLFLGLPFLFVFVAFSECLRGAGDTRTPLIVVAVTVTLNGGLDPLLIFGWGPVPAFGIDGAALATVASRGLAAMIALSVLFGTGGGLSLQLGDCVPRWAQWEELLRLGVPTSLEYSTEALALLSLAGLVATFAPPVIAAYGLVGRIMSLVFLPAMALGTATNTLVGQNIGAEQHQRAKRGVRLALAISSGTLLCIGVIVAIGAEPIISTFIPTGTTERSATIRLGSKYLRIRSVEFVFIGVFEVLLGALRGAGHTTTALGLSFVSLWVGSVLFVGLLAFVAELGPLGIWVGVTTGGILGAGLSWVGVRQRLG